MSGIFFELLQVAIGIRKELSRQLTDVEWEALYGICEKQALLGIAFAGVERLPKEQCPPFDVLAEWVHDAYLIKSQNNKTTNACSDLCVLLKANNIKCCVLKGQGNLVNYPDYIRDYRTPGDIDIWCSLQDDKVTLLPTEPYEKGSYIQYSEKKKIVEFVRRQWRSINIPEPEPRYLHIDAPPIEGISVEIHFRPSFLNNPINNKKLQKWFEMNFQWHVNSGIVDGCTFPIPSNSFNAIYQLTHIYRHLMDEGIGLRQILDYYYVLGALHTEQEELITHSCVKREDGLGMIVYSNEVIMRYLMCFSMRKLVSAMMWLLRYVFDMPKEWMLCEPSEKDGRFLLD